ncbi:MAG: FlgD immunoglobulin-like domain containing protein [bacterium]
MRRGSTLFGFGLLGFVVVAAGSLSVSLAQTPCTPKVVVRLPAFVDYGCPVSAPVRVSSICDLGGFQFDVVFDETLLEFDRVELGPFLGSTGRSVMQLGPVVQVGRVRYGALSFGTQAGSTGSGDLATLTFINRNPGPTRRASTVTLEALELVDTEGRAMETESAPGSVSLLHHIFGDYDEDCEVTVGDAMQLATRWGARSGDERYDPTCDVDLASPGEYCASVPDGDIDIVDVQLVASRWSATCATSTSVTSSAVITAPVSFSFDPPSVAGSEGGLTSVAIVASGAEDLGAFEGRLVFDPEVVEITAVRGGEFLTQGGNGTVSLSDAPTQGAEAVGAFSYGPSGGASGAGTVAYVDLRLRTCGRSELVLEDVRVVSKDGREETLGATSTGEVACAASGVGPGAAAARHGIWATPSPFREGTTIFLEVPAASKLRVDVFDVSGRRVRGLVDSELQAGVHRWQWNGCDDAGRPVPTGIYFVRGLDPTACRTLKVIRTR